MITYQVKYHYKGETYTQDIYGWGIVSAVQSFMSDHAHDVIISITDIEAEEQDRRCQKISYYLIQDHAGRGFRDKTDSIHIRSTWDLSEVCALTGQTLEEYLNDSSLGDEFHNEDIRMQLTRI